MQRLTVLNRKDRSAAPVLMRNDSTAAEISQVCVPLLLIRLTLTISYLVLRTFDGALRSPLPRFPHLRRSLNKRAIPFDGVRHVLRSNARHGRQALHLQTGSIQNVPHEDHETRRRQIRMTKGKRVELIPYTHHTQRNNLDRMGRFSR